MSGSIFRGLLVASGTPGTGNGPDDEFVYGSSIDTIGARYTGAYPWTQLNLRTGSDTVGSNQLSLLCGATTNSMDPNLVVETIDAGDGAWKTQCSMTALATNYQGLGLVLRESSTGKMLCFGPAYDNGYKWQVRRLPNASSAVFTNWTANYGGTAASNLTGYVEVIRDGSTLIFVYSTDSQNWTELVRVAQTADFTTAPNQIGLWSEARQNFSLTDTGVFQYFRKNDRALPYGVPLSNPGAESAIAAPWTNVTGTLGTRAGVQRTGSFAFKIVGNPGAFECYQEWKAIGWDSIFDTGTTTATLAGWGAPWTGATTSFHLELAAYDAGGSQLTTSSTGTWTPSATYSQKSVAITVPTLTRKLRVTFKGTTTAADDAWMDDLTLNLS